MSQVIAVAARLSRRRGRVLLHSGRDDDGCGTWSFIACEPVRTLTARGRHIAIRDRAGALVESFSGDPLAVLQDLIAAHSQGWPDDLSGPVPVAIGYLGYELGQVIEPIEPAKPAEPAEPASPLATRSLPDLWIGFYDAVWRCPGDDAPRGIVLGQTQAAQRRLTEAIAAGPSPSPGPGPALGPLGPPSGSGRGIPAETQAYCRGVARILRYIRAGDVYQVNLARSLTAPVTRPGDPLALYAALHRAAPAPYGAVLSVVPDPGAGADAEPADADTSADADTIHIISGSPERFLHRAPGSPRLETRPIKGTRRRTGNAEHDRARATDLAGDPKERAEHLMIVDLERNDLGRIAQLGSVRVDRLGYVVELPHLYHMVSRVSCRPRSDAGIADILAATFPGGSITGAPKIRAREIIAELEPPGRGPYTGAIGYFGLRQAMDLSIAIRTAVLSPGELRLWVGGGIVADSSAERELEETEEKAAGWHAALAACP